MVAELPPSRVSDPRSTHVLTNQVGYDRGHHKTILLQTSESIDPSDRGFELFDQQNRVRFAGELSHVDRGSAVDWAHEYWSGDFSAFVEPGDYQARVTIGRHRYVSRQFAVDEHPIFDRTVLLATRFYSLQRCGVAVDGLHGACHLEDAILPEPPAPHRLATGGWHDAGDFNKYATIACRSTYALLVLARSEKPRSLAGGDAAAIEEEGLWGADFLLKMWRPGEGTIYQDVWNGYDYFGNPEDETGSRPLRGEGPSAAVAAALAAAARAAARTDFREAAEDLWRGAVAAHPDDTEDDWVLTSGGLPSLPGDSEGRVVRHVSDLLLADIELYALTGEARYASDAATRVAYLRSALNADGQWSSDTYSRTVLHGVPAAALALYAESNSGTVLAQPAIDTLRAWLEGLGRLTENPFQLIPWDNDNFFNPHLDGWYVGQNSQYLSQAWALYLTGRVLGSTYAVMLADRQLDWVLGVNPEGLCMLEGAGTFNPPVYHHRWAPQRERGAVPGAIANGFCRPTPDQDIPWFNLDGSPRTADYHTSEPWEPHNAFYLLALEARERI